MLEYIWNNYFLFPAFHYINSNEKCENVHSLKNVNLFKTIAVTHELIHSLFCEKNNCGKNVINE